MAGIQLGLEDMPPVTKFYCGACVLTTIAVHMGYVTPYQLYFSWDLVVHKLQLWRLLSSFCFYGQAGFSFLFNIIFTYRYCMMLEEGSFRGRRADFVFMFMFGAILMVICGIFAQMLFLGQAFTIMLVYIWSRRNPDIQMNFLGMIAFNAPYLPWVLLFFSLLLGNNAAVDFMGIGCGHIYYFLEDVFPYQEHGVRLLKTPRWLTWIFEERAPEPVAAEERPGGFEWGANEQ
ncbi:unnamed protein product [Caenorhabditis angaria]|uniref:Derlin n=1 Tax=Caenorhabditis angaria TaxID=860376 RepID=A0A9P1IJE6_9PELO|nr:unnamed protein product [Caenorhabditis angaria]